MRVADLIAGVSVAGLLLPEAVAYSAIAGLPASRGVLAGIAGCLVYGLVGRSRFAILSPTSSAAAILAALIAAPPVTGADAASLATVATLLAGLFFLVGAALGLGGLSALIPRPVLRGFAFGIALTIIIRQLPVLAGLAGQGGPLWRELAGVVAALGSANPWSLGCGLAALALYLALKRFRRLPAAFLVVLAGVAASALFGLDRHGVALTGRIDMAQAMPVWPGLPYGGWVALAPFVVPLVLILLAESWGTVSALAASHGDEVEARRELAAFGLANLASGLVQGMPVGAGFSAGSAAEAAGAASRATAIVAALALGALVLLAGPAMARLPLPVLAAVVVGTLLHALSPLPFLRLRRLGRDLPVALAAAGAVMALGAMQGMFLAVALALGGFVRRLMTPKFTLLGRLDGGHDFVDIARHPDAAAPPGVLICRPAEPLFFGNAAGVLAAIRRCQQAEPGIRTLVLSLEETFDLDTTTLDALVDFHRVLHDGGVHLGLARVHDHVRDVLSAAGETSLLLASRYSVDDAVAAAAARGALGTPDAAV